MLNVIPPELMNRRGLQKLRDYYAEQLKVIGGDETQSSLKQLRSDIWSVECKLFPVLAAAQK
jgi:hypothetical protein